MTPIELNEELLYKNVEVRKEIKLIKNDIIYKKEMVHA